MLESISYLLAAYLTFLTITPDARHLLWYSGTNGFLMLQAMVIPVRRSEYEKQ